MGVDQRSVPIETSIKLPLVGADVSTQAGLGDDFSVAQAAAPNPISSVPSVYQRIIAVGTPNEGLVERGKVFVELVRAADREHKAGPSRGLVLGATMLRSRLPRPRQLKTMAVLAGDVLNPAQSHGDVLVQVSGRRGLSQDRVVRRRR